MRALLAVFAIAIAAAPAVADPAAGDDSAAARPVLAALLEAFHGQDYAAVVATLAPTVKVSWLAVGDKLCDKAFRGKRSVRGTKRGQLARCLVAVEPGAEPQLATVAGGWEAVIGDLTFRFAVGKRGVVAITAITGPAPGGKVAFFNAGNKRILDDLTTSNLTNLDKFTALTGTEGLGGGGTGVGTGTTARGTGGGGNGEGNFVTEPGTNSAGGVATTPAEVDVGLGGASGDLAALTKDEIDRVVKSRAGVFRACYQKDLNHSPGLEGKLFIKFVVGADGSVTSVAVVADKSTLAKNEVAACVSSQILRLKFPAKGSVATISYPFTFAAAKP